MSSDGELSLSVRAIEDDDRAWLHETVLATWCSNRMWVSGRLVDDVSALPGLLAERAGERVGYVLVTPDAEGAQVIALESLQPRRGVATALLAGLQEEARRLGWSRLWLTTTNDNLDAIRLYQRRGWELVAFHRDSVTAGRRLKPEIPERGAYGIAIRHELEFEAPAR